jgi:hypothetical protein
MANNLIQIKRSNTSPTPANTLNGGELGYSYNSNALFIGAQTGISAASFKIGGYKYNYVDQATQGTLTANAVILVDANAFISNTFTSGLFIAGSIASPAANTTAALITSISPQGTTTQLGASAGGSNTELVTSYAIKTYVDGQIVAHGVNTAVQYTFTNTEIFNANVVVGGGSTSTLVVGNNSTSNVTVNATTVYVTGGAGVGNFYANSTQYGVGNSSVYTYANSTHFYSGNSTVYGYGNNVADVLYNTTGNNQLTLTASNLQIQNTTSSLNITAAAISVGNTATNTSINTTAVSTATVIASANANLGSQVTVTNTSVNFGTISSITATSANLSVGSLNVSGTLTVTGNTLIVNSTILEVNSNFVQLTDNNTSDILDLGFYGRVANTTNTMYSGMFRDAAASEAAGALASPIFKLFASNTAPGSTVSQTSNATNFYAQGILQAYLQPFGSGGAFVVNSTAVTATANATVAVNITANTLTITSGLAATSGGTGRTTGFTAGDILFASNATYVSNLAVGSNGYVLQVTNNLPAWGTLDGGTF